MLLCNVDGKMVDIRVVEELGNVVPVPGLEGTVTAFFLNGKGAPVHTSLPIS